MLCAQQVAYGDPSRRREALQEGAPHLEANPTLRIAKGLNLSPLSALDNG